MIYLMPALSNVRNVVQFYIFDMLSVIALALLLQLIEPDRTMKLNTSVVYIGKYRPLLRLAVNS